MKDKNKQSDYQNMDLEELTNEANILINFLENHENIENQIEIYQNLLKLNNLIEKKFHNNNKKISLQTKERINKIFSKKNAS